MLAIPGVAPNAFWNTSTNRLYTTLLGSSTGTTQFKGGSALQGPTVTLNVTATAPQTTDLQVKLGGQLPGSEPRNYTGAQPDNFARSVARRDDHELRRNPAVLLDQRT